MTNKEAKEKLYMEWQKFLEDNIDYAGISEAYKMAFKALGQEPRWIAVSERLPDAGDYVLVTVSAGSEKAVDMDFYSAVEKEGFEGYGKDVVAWMPLPAPYKGE